MTSEGQLHRSGPSSVPEPREPGEKPLVLDALAQSFVDHLASDKGASTYTLRNYSQALAEFSRWIGQEKNAQPDWPALERDDFRHYLRSLGRWGLSPAAIRLRFSALRSLYKHLIRTGKAQTSPVRQVTLPKPPKRLPRFLTAEQMTRLLGAPARAFAALKGKADGRRPALSYDRDAAILETLYSCGLRISELCALRMEDIDWNDGMIRVRGKGRKER
ncbi:MAG: tyrosine recombinase XerC, partial [Verrucomicrobia bacterium]|nr:tyrosine recombinase XerC [Verrucomicrobiota bacterium]